MLSPMSFLSHIKHEQCDPVRKRLARLALNLYFDPAAHPFDVSELGKIGIQESLAIAMAAIAWAHSQGVPFLGPEPQRLLNPFIHPLCERWLARVSAGEDPFDGDSPV